MLEHKDERCLITNHGISGRNVQVNGATSRVDIGCGVSTEQQAEWTQDAVCQRSNKQSGHRMRCVNGATSRVDTGCGMSTDQQAEWT